MKNIMNIGAVVLRQGRFSLGSMRIKMIAWTVVLTALGGLVGVVAAYWGVPLWLAVVVALGVAVALRMLADLADLAERLSLSVKITFPRSINIALLKLLALFPSEFRQKYGVLIALEFEQQFDEAYNRGRWVAARIWLKSVADLLRGAVAEWGRVLIGARERIK